MNEDLKNLLADVFEVKSNEINSELTREDIDSWDSLKQMDLVTSLEKKYEIELEIFDIVELTSVGKIVETLESKGISVAN